MRVQARDIKVENWYFKISIGEIKFPRFQRRGLNGELKVEST